MISNLFSIPLFHCPVNNWNDKKNDLLNKMDHSKFGYYNNNDFLTDRCKTKSNYIVDFENIFSEELNQFKKEIGANEVRVKDVWTVKYVKPSHNHCPHNHSGSGYSGALYLEYDPNVHSSLKFISPWNNPITDKTQLCEIESVGEGIILIWPSFLLHYVDAIMTDKLRMVTSWDMEVK